MEENAIEAYKTASEIASRLPSEYRTQAFQVLFEKELAANRSGIAPKKREPQAEAALQTELKTILASEIDYSEFHHAILKGNWADRAAIILFNLENALGIRALSAPDLAEVMKHQLKLSQVHRQNVYRDMRRSKYFVKTKLEKGDLYSLSLLGVDRVKSLQNK